MAQTALLRRLLSPTGYALVACCFLLPFVTVSCSPSPGPVWNATYTGKDLVVGDRAELGLTDRAGHPLDPADVTPDPVPPIGDADLRYTKPIEPQPFLIVALALASLGILAGAVPWPWWRGLAGSGLALAAAVFLAGGEVVALRAAVVRVNADAQPLIGSTTSQSGTTPEVVSPEAGFWLALLLLLLLAAAHVTHLVRLSRRPGRADPAAVAHAWVRDE